MYICILVPKWFQNGTNTIQKWSPNGPNIVPERSQNHPKIVQKKYKFVFVALNFSIFEKSYSGHISTEFGKTVKEGFEVKEFHMDSFLVPKPETQI